MVKGLTLAEQGEWNTIRSIANLLPKDHWAVDVGVGDDAAVLRYQPYPWVVTCDSLVENVHYRAEWSNSVSVGHKLAHVNLSDLAAMGASPAVAFIAATCPGSVVANDLLDLHQALQAELSVHGATLAGGNLSSSCSLSCFTLTLMGLVSGAPLTRAGAQVGDRVYITGHIGDSGAGLRLLMAGLVHVAEANVCVTRQLRPVSRLGIGRYLSQHLHPTACVDVSDGLALDALHLAQASGVSLRIKLGDIPLSDSFCNALRRLNLPPISENAVRFGEDYELLFTLPSSVTVPPMVDGVLITGIGEVVDHSDGNIIWERDGDIVSVDEPGWEHFRVQR